MPRFKFVLTFIAPLALAGTLAAQHAVPALQGTILDGTGLPGQAWTAIGNLSPIEHDGYFQSYVEQSSAIFVSRSGSITLTPFVALGLVLDTKGYVWDNQIEPRIGFKANKRFRSGMVSLGSAYAYEARFSGISGSGLVLYAQDWFGWHSVTDKASRFPGSTWASVGNISPVEHGNIIGELNVSQGIVAKRFTKTTLVPYGEVTLWRNSKHFDWDNKLIYGTGLKAAFPHGDLYSELGAAYFREHRFDSGRTAGGLTLFMNVSFAWNLLGRNVGGR